MVAVSGPSGWDTVTSFGTLTQAVAENISPRAGAHCFDFAKQAFDIEETHIQALLIV